MQKYFPNMKINNLTLIEFDKIKKKWIAKCNCGNLTSVNSSSFKSVYSCKNCRKGKEIPSQQEPNNLGLWKDYYRQYKNNARIKNHEFYLELEQFKEITRKNCFYCNQEPIKEFKVKIGKSKEKSTRYLLINGIDRKNNQKGYVMENCVPCCEICNMAKRELSIEKFILWIEKVYKLWFNDYPEREYSQVAGSTEYPDSRIKI